MTHLTYNEDHLVEQPALEALAKLGWHIVNARDEIFGQQGTLGRDSKVDVKVLDHA
jgi:type I restriction enzyme R subunit